jgi:hypothetical protein
VSPFAKFIEYELGATLELIVPVVCGDDDGDVGVVVGDVAGVVVSYITVLLMLGEVFVLLAIIPGCPEPCL